MVYCLTVNFVVPGTEQAAIDDLKSKVKTRTNAALWQGDVSWKKNTYTNSNGRLVLSAVVRYLNEADMDITLNWMKAKAATYSPLMIGPEGGEPGSYVEAHICDHKKSAEGTHSPGDKCTKTYRWDK